MKTRSPWLALALIACAEKEAPPARPAPELVSKPIAAKAGDAAPPAAPDVAAAPTPGAILFRFSDATAASGIDFEHLSGRSGRRYYLEPHTGGCAAFDADGDGLTDLYAVDGGPLPGYRGDRKHRSRLFRNQGGGTFTDVTDKSGLAGHGYGFGAYAADYDGDGDDDLFVTNYGDDELFRNRGDGTFEEVGAAAGVNTGGWSTGAAWFDADEDGDLDLWITHYLKYTTDGDRECWHRGIRNYCSPYDYAAYGDQLFRNNGDGTFTDVSRDSGVLADTGKGLGAFAYDLDQDGRPDLYVANDETRNLFYHNLGAGKFEEIGVRVGVAVNSAGGVQAGMGIDAGDIDADGRPDLVVGNFQHEPINDYRQEGPLLFTDRALTSGLGVVSTNLLSFATLLFDVDLDGDLDLFVANGHVWDNIAESEPTVKYAQRNILARNDDGQFTDVAAQAGEVFTLEEVTRSGCLIDYDADGDLDLFSVNIDGPARLLRNDTPHGDRHWLGLRFIGRKPNTQAIGARWRIEADGRVLQGQNWRVRGYLSSSQRTQQMGLGAAARVERLTVTWPDGATIELKDLDADRVYGIDQATGKHCAGVGCVP